MSASPAIKPPAAPRFVTLSELDHRSMRVRDWLTLLPLLAILLSVVLFFATAPLFQEC